MDQSNNIPVLYLAGDSINQTASETDYPRVGMGEKLLKYLDEETKIRVYHRESSPFPTQMCYEGSSLILDNCAMAGRSSKTFLEEGRLEDIKLRMKEGDFLLVQFGHNDASASKPERRVAVAGFPSYLNRYVEAAGAAEAHPILISPICLCPGEETRSGEKGEIAGLLPEYTGKMREYAKKEQIPFIDMYHLTEAYCKKAGEAEAKSLYMPDLVHLVEKGADYYAGMLANKLKCLIIAGK